MRMMMRDAIGYLFKTGASGERKEGQQPIVEHTDNHTRTHARLRTYVGTHARTHAHARMYARTQAHGRNTCPSQGYLHSFPAELARFASCTRKQVLQGRARGAFQGYDALQEATPCGFPWRYSCPAPCGTRLGARGRYGSHI